MGEYALYGGEEVKIGTCESMYYLRWDQRKLVTPLPGNTDPKSLDAQKHCLWRFPWPGEDDVEPGAFDSAWYQRRIYGVTVPEGVDHGICQFTSHNGWLLNMPCPEAIGFAAPEGWGMHKNGYRGACSLVAQRWWQGKLVGVMQCNGCSHLYRMPTLVDAEPVLEALLMEAADQLRTAELNDTPGNATIAHAITETARRLRVGYSA